MENLKTEARRLGMSPSQLRTQRNLEQMEKQRNDPTHQLQVRQLELQSHEMDINTFKYTREQHTNAIKSTKDKLLTKMYQQYIELKLEHEPETMHLDVFTKSVCTKLAELKERASPAKQKVSHVWVTINPKPDAELTDFIHVVEKIVTKSWIEGYVYTYEQRGTDMDTLGTGFHAHLLFPKGDKPPSHISRELQNTCKHIVGNPKHVHIVYITDDDVLQKIRYMQGHKTADDKALKVTMDKVWRNEHGFDDIYYEGFDVSFPEGEEAQAAAASQGTLVNETLENSA